MPLFKLKLPKNKSIVSNENAQSTTEYVLFLVVLFAASYGMIKLFILAWKIRFNALGCVRDILNAFI